MQELKQHIKVVNKAADGKLETYELTDDDHCFPNDQLKDHVCSSSLSMLEKPIRVCQNGQSLVMDQGLGDPEKTAAWIHMIGAQTRHF